MWLATSEAKQFCLLTNKASAIKAFIMSTNNVAAYLILQLVNDRQIR